MKQPPANRSPEAVALRKAAWDWAHLDVAGLTTDPNDRIGAAANRRLLKAAQAYAERADR